MYPEACENWGSWKLVFSPTIFSSRNTCSLFHRQSLRKGLPCRHDTNGKMGHKNSTWVLEPPAHPRKDSKYFLQEDPGRGWKSTGCYTGLFVKQTECRQVQKYLIFTLCKGQLGFVLQNLQDWKILQDWISPVSPLYAFRYSCCKLKIA